MSQCDPQPAPREPAYRRWGDHARAGESLPPRAPARFLAGRTILVTGVLRPSSIATGIVEEILSQGGCVVLTAPWRTLRLTQSVARARGWGQGVRALAALDLTRADDVAGLAGTLRGQGVEILDGVVHAVAHADAQLLGDTLLPPMGEPRQASAGPSARPGQEADEQDWSQWHEHLAHAFAVSVASLPALVAATGSLLSAPSDVVALTFASDQVAPGYGWMGPMKAALEATVRHLAVELAPASIRVNAVSAGPLRTPAASAIPRFSDLAASWSSTAPLSWDATDPAPVARTVAALLGGALPATTGQVLAADGGARLPL